MPGIRAIFWDVGGVLLTNAWDHAERDRAVAEFGIDSAEFTVRHEMLVSSFERGKIGLDEYLARTVFYCSRPFALQTFRHCMFSFSQPRPEFLEVARRLRESGKYRMATINNESRELNLFRIHKYGLDKLFDFFVSSCFVGLRKPEGGIYRLALDLVQVPAEECCLVDDRSLNVEAAAQFGMHALRIVSAARLKHDLQELGVREFA